MARCRLVRALRFAVALLLLCAWRGTAAPLRVPLAIAEPAGVARKAEPVTVGVPLPAGRVRTTAGLWIADPSDHPALSQTHILERWPDGSIRWLLLDFLASAGADETVTYTLRDGGGKAAAFPDAVRTARTATDIVLTSGPLELTVPRDATATLRSARLKGRPALGEVPVPDPAVAEQSPGALRDLRSGIETEGPVRTEVLLQGRYPSDLTFELRIAAFAGQPWVRVQLTLTSFSSRSYSRITSFPFTVRGRFASGAVGVGGGARRFEDLKEAHTLAQWDAGAPALDGTPLAQQADGWLRAAGDGVAVTLVRRYLREEWPQALRVGPGELTVDLLAGHGDETVDLGIGAAKTFDLWIAIEDPAHAADPAALATRLQHPLVARPDAAWIVASRALPNALAAASPGAASFFSRLQIGIGRYLARGRAERWDDGPPVPCDQRTSERERVGTYGALNWGDWNFPGYRDRSEGCDAWGNLEYDLTQVLGLAWAGTGAREDWDAFIAAGRHYRDVDIIHFAPGHEDVVGINHPHKVKHFAVESPNTIDLGHTWLEGLVTHYRLTGEVRSLDAARGIADVLVRRRYKAGNPRQFGWPMIALAAAYDATGDGRYRDAAKSYADTALGAHQATPAAGDWKMGILADGLAAVHAITGEPRIRDWLVRYADALVAEASRFEDPRYALPLGYLAVLTKNASYRRLGLATVDRMEIGDWGKTLAISGRCGFRILGPLAVEPAPAPTPARAAPPRGSASGRRSR